MAGEPRPIGTKRDLEAALNEVERLWGAKAGTRDGDRLDVLATLIDAYDAQHYPMDPPDPIEAIKFRIAGWWAPLNMARRFTRLTNALSLRLCGSAGRPEMVERRQKGRPKHTGGEFRAST